jgi:hypothetical protein
VERCALQQEHLRDALRTLLIRRRSRSASCVLGFTATHPRSETSCCSRHDSGIATETDGQWREWNMSLRTADPRSLGTLEILGAESPRVAPNGPTTQRFFAEGELHEGTQWKYARLPPDDAVESTRGARFDSFDKVPRQYQTVLALLVIGASLAISSAAWTMVFRSTGVRVTLSSRISAVLADLHPTEARVLARPLAGPEVVEIPTVAPKAPPEPAPRSPREGVARPRAANPLPPSRPLKGFVWSSTIEGLVPAVPAPGAEP